MFKKIRFTFLYLSAFLRKNSIFLILGLTFGIILFLKRFDLITLYHQLNQPRIIIGREGQFVFNSLPPDISRQISFGLTAADEKGKMDISPIIDNLDIQNNNQNYIFTFRPDLEWHNQKKFNSSDILLDIPGTEITYPTPLSLQINLQGQFSPAMAIFNRPLFLGKTAYGLGPYQVRKIEYQDGFIKTLSLKSSAGDPSLTYKFFTSEKDLFNAFRLGQVNQIITNSLPSDIENWPKLKVTKDIDTAQYIALFLNTQTLPSKQTRQAIAYATPKTNDKNIRCISPLSPESWAYNPSVKDYNFNATRAKELYESNQVPQIRLAVADRKLLQLAENIKKSWSEVLEISTEIITANRSNLTEYDVILAFGQIPADPDQYTFWHSTQSQTNITRLNNSRIDKLLEEGRTIFDQIERKNIYADFQKYLLEESPAVFLEFPTVYTITRIN